MAKTAIGIYEKYVALRLKQLQPILQKYALGDFSKSIDIPEEEDEFTELLVGLSLMVDDIKEIIDEKEETIKRLTQMETKLNKTVNNLSKSERKYRELSEHLTESNSMKELLLDIIAHDLKNPAGVIKGFAQMGLENDPGNVILDEIDIGAESLLNVINNATVLSKVTIGDDIEKGRVDLTNMIKSIIKEFLPQLEDPEMTLDMKMKDGIIVNANPIIGEVFRNYINNAIKYGKIGKKIVIDTNRDNGDVIVNVKDYGKTIDKKNRKNIFTRKFQIASSAGRGLGLAIVKRIADAHDAQVGVKPNNSKGNIFYCKLPLADPKAVIDIPIVEKK